ncbi:MAG: F0F1 ATP synthase subunit A [Caulobacterales bacterium]
MRIDADPMTQFKLERLVPLDLAGFDISFTNAALWMAVAVALITGVIWLGANGAKLVPTRTQSVVEMFYGFVRNTVESTIGHDGLKFFPLIFTLFSFILTLNLIGMSPLAFTVTSHLSITGALAILVFAIVLFVGFSKNGIGFFSRFWPAGAPWWIAWLIALIEFISFLIRPFTLAIRLFANMLAGHTMLKVLASFIPLGLAAGGAGLLAALGSTIGVVGVTALEFLVAGLQAYVFTILTCIYLSEVVHDPHH